MFKKGSKSPYSLGSTQVNPNSSMSSLHHQRVPLSSMGSPGMGSPGIGSPGMSSPGVGTPMFATPNGSVSSFMPPDSPPLQLFTPPLSNSTTPVHEKIGFQFQEPKTMSLRIVVLCGLWYLCSIFSSNSSKIILTSFKYPVTLTQFQFTISTLFSVLFYAFLLANPRVAQLMPSGSIPNIKEVDSLKEFMTPSRTVLNTTGPMGLFSFMGHILSHKAVSLIPVSTVHTIKALSPIATVLAFRLGFNVKFKTVTYLSLVPLILGVMLTCYKGNGNSGFYLTGLIFAFVSMLIFVAQNIFAKKRITPKENLNTLPVAKCRNEPALDKLTVLLNCSVVGFCLTSPVYLISEFNNGVFSLAELSFNTLSLVLLNGASHFAQSFLAFQILGSVSPVSYSIASILKRIFVIIVAFIWESKQFTNLQILGLIFTVSGLYCYDRWGK